MKNGLNILQAAALNLVSLGALNHRVDSGSSTSAKRLGAPVAF